MEQTAKTISTDRYAFVCSIGSPIHPWALYNARQDAMVAPGLKFWKEKTLNENVLEKQMPYTDSEVVGSNSFESKANSLDVGAELKASFLAGLVTVSGAGTVDWSAHCTGVRAGE